MNQTNITNSLTSFRPTHSLYYKISIFVLIAFALLSILTNCYFLLSCRWIKKRFSSNLRLTVSLATVDTWISFLFSISLILNSYYPVVLNQQLPELNCLRLFLESLRLGAIETSILHVLFLSVNQLIAIVHPLYHRMKISGRIIAACLLILWIVPTLTVTIYFSAVPDQGYLAPKCFSFMLIQRNFRVTVFLFMVTPLIITLFVNFAIIVRLRKVRKVNLHLRYLTLLYFTKVTSPNNENTSNQMRLS